MNITLKNIKYSAFASQETHCFEATIYINNKRFCIVHNQGHGGCDDYLAVDNCQHEFDGKLWEEVNRINNILGKETLPSEFSSEGLPNDLEIAVCDLVNEWHENKDIKKALRRICYLDDDGVVNHFNAKLKPTAHNIVRVRNQDWFKSTFIILNELAFNDAKTYLMES